MKYLFKRKVPRNAINGTTHYYLAAYTRNVGWVGGERNACSTSPEKKRTPLISFRNCALLGTCHMCVDISCVAPKTEGRNPPVEQWEEYDPLKPLTYSSFHLWGYGNILYAMYASLCTVVHNDVYIVVYQGGLIGRALICPLPSDGRHARSEATRLMAASCA